MTVIAGSVFCTVISYRLVRSFSLSDASVLFGRGCGYVYSIPGLRRSSLFSSLFVYLEMVVFWAGFGRLVRLRDSEISVDWPSSKVSRQFQLIRAELS